MPLPSDAYLGVETIVVLGCRVCWDPASGRLVGALARRVEGGAAVARRLDVPVVTSGGRAWGGVLEADAMADELARCGVDAARVLRERRSRSTRENAQHVAELLLRGDPGVRRRIVVVTCDWHLPRATALFQARGFEVAGAPVPSGHAGLGTRAWRWGREHVAGALDRL